MDIQFNFKLADFKISGTKILKTCDGKTEQIRYSGYSGDLARDGYFEISGVQKCAAFEMFLNDSSSKNLFLLYAGPIIFALAFSDLTKEMEQLYYFLICGDENMNGLMDLNTLHSYYSHWMNKSGPASFGN